MTYQHVLDWAATLAGTVFCAFLICAGGVVAWHDRRGAAHRLPMLGIVASVGLLVAFGCASAILVGPYHVGSAWWAQGAAYVVILASGVILWHGFGTCLKGFVPKRATIAPGEPQATCFGDREQDSSRETLNA